MISFKTVGCLNSWPFLSQLCFSIGIGKQLSNETRVETEICLAVYNVVNQGFL